MLVYYFVPFIVSNRYLLFWVSQGHNSVTVQNRTHVYMNFFDHKDLGIHLLQLCSKVVKQPVYTLLIKSALWREVGTTEGSASLEQVSVVAHYLNSDILYVKFTLYVKVYSSVQRKGANILKNFHRSLSTGRVPYLNNLFCVFDISCFLK